MTTTTTATAAMATTVKSGHDVSKNITANDFHDAVTTMVHDSKFIESTKSTRVPLAMLAFAKIVVDHVLRPKDINVQEHFNGLTMSVPPLQQSIMAPEYHSIVGQKLLYVDWIGMCGLEITCPHCQNGVLLNDRTNFSKNKILFPIYVIDGPPMWAMIMSMTCSRCKHRVNSNAAEVLCTLPACARSAYPVETKHALSKNSHIGVSATTVFDLLMPTHGNGDLCSWLLYHAINRAYLERVEDYYSIHTIKGSAEKEGPSKYVELHGHYVRAYPPTGDGIRDAYDAACSNSCTPWHLSDHDRHVREIQKVGCSSIFAQDHTHKVTDNYYQKKGLGAFALWDCANENGEIAAAVLVPTTKTIHFAHAATALTKRPHFNPSAMYSDT